MKTRILLVALLVIALPLLGAGKWQEEFAKHLKISGEFTVAVAEMMPEDSYSFKPNPEEMGFGELFVHSVMYQAATCARVGESKSPLTKPATMDKATVLKLIKDAFEFCNDIVPKLTDEQLDRMFGKAGGPQSSGREALWGAFTHTAHHRAQTEVYLRVKNIKPPNYRF
jgi:hypothetical protein